MKFSIVELCRIDDGGGQMAERLGSRAINQTVAGSIPGPTELAPIYATRANLLMQAHSKFDVMLVQEFDS